MMSKTLVILLVVAASVSAQNFQYSALLDPDGHFFIRWNIREATNDIQMRIELFGKGWLSLLIASSDGSYADLWFGGYDDTTNRGYLDVRTEYIHIIATLVLDNNYFCFAFQDYHFNLTSAVSESQFKP